jgi:hypothetical protein
MQELKGQVQALEHNGQSLYEGQREQHGKHGDRRLSANLLSGAV